MVHHGGHSSVMTGLSAGTPAVIISTSTERESNARRPASRRAHAIAATASTAPGPGGKPLGIKIEVRQVMGAPPDSP